MISTNLWIPQSHHICLTYKQPGTHLVGWHQKVPPYTTTKSDGSGHEKQKGNDWSLSKDKASGKVGIEMSGMQPDTG